MVMMIIIGVIFLCVLCAASSAAVDPDLHRFCV